MTRDAKKSSDYLFHIGPEIPTDDEGFEEFWNRFNDETATEVAEIRDRREEIKRKIFSENASAIKAMHLLHISGTEAVNWASETVIDGLSDDSEDDHLADYMNTVTGLAGRALLAYDELTWLLEGGFPDGAFTRLRSIHELFIVAATLGLHGGPDGDCPDLIERYRAHQDIFTPKRARDLRATEIDGVEETLNGDILKILDNTREELVQRYGRSFKSSWGWAAPLFADGHASFTRLGELVLPEFDLFYGMASSKIHASSEGLGEATHEREDGSPYFLAGARTEDLATPAVLGSTLLVGIIGAVVPVERPEDEEVDLGKTGRYFHGALVRLLHQVIDGWPDEDNESDHQPEE